MVDTKITTKAGEITQLITDVKEVVGDDTKGLTLKVNQTKNTADSAYSLLMTNDGSGKGAISRINEAINTAEISQRTVGELTAINELIYSAFVGTTEGLEVYKSGTLTASTSGAVITAASVAETGLTWQSTTYFYSGVNYALSFGVAGTAGLTASAKLEYTDGTAQSLGSFTISGGRKLITFKPNKSGAGRLVFYFNSTSVGQQLIISRVMLKFNSTTHTTYVENVGALGATMTQVTQLKDSWALKIKSGKDLKTEINATTDGIRLKGKIIELDGDVLMNNAFARKLYVDNLTTADITAHMAKFGGIIANTIDVNSLTGNKATFIQTLFNGVHSKLKITGDSIDFVGNNGYTASRMHNFGTQYFRNGTRAGWVQTYEGGIGLIADAGNDLVLGNRTDNNSAAFKQALTVRSGDAEMTAVTPLRVMSCGGR